MKLIYLIAILLIVSCKSHYTTQLCDETNKIDLPTVVNDDTLYSSSKFQITKVAPSKYKIPGKGVFTSCFVGTTVIAEFTTNGQNFFSYKLSIDPSSNSISVTDLKFDKKALDEKNIPYQDSRELLGTVTIADNAGIPKALFIQSLKDDVTISITKHQ